MLNQTTHIQNKTKDCDLNSSEKMYELVLGFQRSVSCIGSLQDGNGMNKDSLTKHFIMQSLEAFV